MEEWKSREIKYGEYDIDIEINQESYYIDVYYDVMLDDICFETRYRFENKLLAEQFMEYVNRLNCTTTSEISYESTRSTMGYDHKNPYRPRFSTLEDAIEDLKLCLQCRNIHIHMNEVNYKYINCIHMTRIEEFELTYLRREVERLKKENEELHLKLNGRHLGL